MCYFFFPMIKRPPIVWVVQGLLLILVFPMIWILVLLCFAAMLLPGGNLLVEFSYPTFVVSFFLAAVWGLAKRRPYGRWLGVSALLFLVVLANADRIADPSIYVIFCMYSSMLGYLGLPVISSVIFLMLTVALGLSSRANHFFSQSPEEILASRPPLPPRCWPDY
jgi:hypothetical protein